MNGLEPTIRVDVSQYNPDVRSWDTIETRTEHADPATLSPIEGLETFLREQGCRPGHYRLLLDDVLEVEGTWSDGALVTYDEWDEL